MSTKSNAVAIGVILTALMTSGVASPAFAKNGADPGFDACFALAMERGSGPMKGGDTKEESQYNAFMSQCRSGKIPVDFGANHSLDQLELPANAHASKRARH